MQINNYRKIIKFLAREWAEEGGVDDAFMLDSAKATLNNAQQDLLSEILGEDDRQ